MAGIRQLDRRAFPLQDISSVVRQFKRELDSKTEPDLALLSIIVGAVENSMTCNRTFPTPSENDVFGEPKQLPAVEYHIVDALYSKFHAVIKGAVDLSLYAETKYATRELIKRVSDVIWNSLTRSYYKDRAHLQSLYSYLTGRCIKLLMNTVNLLKLCVYVRICNILVNVQNIYILRIKRIMIQKKL